ncbi:hypothetical protein [Streptomyces sp. NBC_01477]|uniref:hypothetical protein n=1 Tax=Streptomyces sp. NBC_01477 TaxID=2976015 RepID=UPI002E310C42|nr:hypothetical protein [Streptomyces sp. NBC_01477]
MTALLDTRRALEEQFAALGERVESTRREVVDTVASQAAELRGDNRETRTRVNSLSTALSETNKAVPVLRQEVADLARSLQALHAAVDDIALRLSHAPELPRAGGAPSSARGHDLAGGVAADAGTPPAIAEPGVPETEHEESVVLGPEDAGVLRSEQKPAPASPAAASPAAGPDQASDTGPTDDADLMESRARSAESGSAADDGKHSRARHDNILRSAGTAGTVEITCHRELWEFIQQRADDTPHFRAPAALVEDGGDRVRAILSGRSVIGVLIAMRATQLDSAPYGKDDGTWALSEAVYDRLAHDLATTSRHGGTPLTIVFDDGTAPETSPASE